MTKIQMRTLGLVLFFTFAAFVIASASTLKQSRMIDDPSSWTNVPVPQEMLGRDQWYQKPN